MADLEQAIQIAVEAHKGQRRRNGTPYVLHPLRVMLAFEDETRRVIGVLHDVVEDSDWTCADLEAAGFSRPIVEAVDALTKRQGEAYDDYLTRLSPNPLARAVKLADLRDNMNVLELPGVNEKDGRRMERYLRAYRRLAEQDT